MHTVICAFQDDATGREAIDQLTQCGFARQDMHLEHRTAQDVATGIANWDGLEREIAVDRGVARSFGAFFASVLGVDHPSGRVDTYTQHVESGGCVLVLDAHDEAEAQRARAIVTGLGAAHHDVLDRGTQRPVRDILSLRQADNQPRDLATGGIAEPLQPRERAMARDEDELTHVGLRYADKGSDKPNS
jgi:hypothetical protein